MDCKLSLYEIDKPIVNNAKRHQQIARTIGNHLQNELNRRRTTVDNVIKCIAKLKSNWASTCCSLRRLKMNKSNHTLKTIPKTSEMLVDRKTVGYMTTKVKS